MGGTLIMRRLCRLFVAALLAAAPSTALAAAPRYAACPGSYAVSPMTEWDKITNDDRDYSFLPLLNAKPDELTQALSDKERAAATYAFIRLGTAQQGIYVAFGRESGANVDFLYVDANNDKRLAAEERVDLKKGSPFSNQGNEIQWTETAKPVACSACYARGDGTLVVQPVSLRFHFLRVTITSGRSGSTTRYLSYYVIDTWFTGTGRFRTDKGDEREMPFAILDGNDNGVFNDYGRDVLLVDGNGDGQFDMKKEMAPLFEFEEIKLDSKNFAQQRKVMFAWPAVLVVQPARDAIDWTAVEPG